MSSKLLPDVCKNNRPPSDFCGGFRLQLLRGVQFGRCA